MLVCVSLVIESVFCGNVVQSFFSLDYAIPEEYEQILESSRGSNDLSA